jgi:hypothetical protein
VLVVSEGLDWLARQFVRQRADTQAFPVMNGALEHIAQVEPTDRDSAAAKGARLLFAIVAGGFDATRRDNRELRLARLDGGTVLGLHIAGNVLEVHDPGGGWIGVVNNRSDFKTLRLDFQIEPPRRRLLFETYGEPAATVTSSTEDPPFDVVGPQGNVLAEVTNSGRLDRLEWRAPVDERLRALVVAFACGLVDRVWLRRPAVRGHS